MTSVIALKEGWTTETQHCTSISQEMESTIDDHHMSAE